MNSYRKPILTITALATVLIISFTYWASVNNKVDSHSGVSKLSKEDSVKHPWKRLHSHSSLPVSQLKASFAILDSQPIAVPTSLLSRAESTLGAPKGTLASLEARYAGTSDGKFWILFDASVVCLIQDGKGAIACGSIADVLANGLALGVFDPPKEERKRPTNFLVLGLAPNWASEVRLRVGRDRHARVPIQGNVYSQAAPVPVTIEELAR